MTPTLKNRPGNFLLPSYDQARKNGEKNGRLSHIFLSMASDERVIEQTPSLQRLEEILARPIP